jgi:hypothetical protein
MPVICVKMNFAYSGENAKNIIESASSAAAERANADATPMVISG